MRKEMASMATGERDRDNSKSKENTVAAKTVPRMGV
jgi:hypothetical protein